MDIQKLNIIRIAKHHKKHCDGEKCNITLAGLLFVAIKAGIKFSKKEQEIFM